MKITVSAKGRPAVTLAHRRYYFYERRRGESALICTAPFPYTWKRGRKEVSLQRIVAASPWTGASCCHVPRELARALPAQLIRVQLNRRASYRVTGKSKERQSNSLISLLSSTHLSLLYYFFYWRIYRTFYFNCNNNNGFLLMISINSSWEKDPLYNSGYFSRKRENFRNYRCDIMMIYL